MMLPPADLDILASVAAIGVGSLIVIEIFQVPLDTVQFLNWVIIDGVGRLAAAARRNLRIDSLIPFVQLERPRVHAYYEPHREILPNGPRCSGNKENKACSPVAPSYSWTSEVPYLALLSKDMPSNSNNPDGPTTSNFLELYTDGTRNHLPRLYSDIGP